MCDWLPFLESYREYAKAPPAFASGAFNVQFAGDVSETINGRLLPLLVVTRLTSGSSLFRQRAGPYARAPWLPTGLLVSWSSLPVRIPFPCGNERIYPCTLARLGIGASRNEGELSAELEARRRTRDGLIEHCLERIGNLLGLLLVSFGRRDFGRRVEQVLHRGLDLVGLEADFGEDAADQLFGVRLERLGDRLGEQARKHLAERLLVAENDVLLHAVLVAADDGDVLLLLATTWHVHLVGDLDGRHVRLERVVVEAALAGAVVASFRLENLELGFGFLERFFERSALERLLGEGRVEPEGHDVLRTLGHRRAGDCRIVDLCREGDRRGDGLLLRKCLERAQRGGLGFGRGHWSAFSWGAVRRL